MVGLNVVFSIYAQAISTWHSGSFEKLANTIGYKLIIKLEPNKLHLEENLLFAGL